MTLEEARQLIWQAKRVNLTCLSRLCAANRSRDYLLVIELADRDKLIFADAMKAHLGIGAVR
jgi:hypothetical protein